MRHFPVILLVLIVIFAFLLRFFLVGTHPAGVSIDEASFGINANSILQTGKDEHGKPYPLIFTAFGDHKLPAYAYLLVPTISVLGFTNEAVRFPSVIAGTLIALSMFFLLRRFGFKEWQSLIASLITAVSPWGIILSRFGYESNVGLLFFILGLVSFFTYIKNKRTYLLILTGVFFGLTWYSYIAYRLTIPLIIAALIIIFLGVKRKSLPQIGILLVSFMLVVAPLVPSLFSSQGTARFNQVGILSNSGIIMQIDESRSLCNEDLPRILCYGLFNKPVVYLRTLADRFINVYTPDYLFLRGERDLHNLSVRNYGVFPILLMPFFIAGLILSLGKLLKRKLTKLELFCLIGLVISSIPAVLASEAHRVRLSPLFPFIVITIIYGIAYVDELLKKQSHRVLFYSGMTLLLIASSAFFMLNYLTIHIKKYETTYQNHTPRLVEYIQSQTQDTGVYITSFGYSIYYYLYHTKTSPVDIQQHAVWEEPDDTGFAHITDYKNLHVTWKSTGEVFCKDSMKYPHAIFITDTKDKNLRAIHIIKTYDNVHEIFYVYDINQNRPTVCQEGTKDL